MTRSTIEPPDEFSVNPLLSILPIVQGAEDLARYSSALFARFERAATLHREGSAKSGDAAAVRRAAAEEQMLRQVLDVLRLKTNE